MAKGRPGWRGGLIVAVSGAILPLIILIYAFTSPMTRPSPISIDGPAYILMGLLLLAGISLPLCLAAALGGVMLSRRGNGRAAAHPNRREKRPAAS